MPRGSAGPVGKEGGLLVFMSEANQMRSSTVLRAHGAYL